MSKDAKQNINQISINTLLKSLTNRPNVQSTLILSRKDGTIIRATGFASSESKSSISSRSYEESQSTGNTIAHSLPGGEPSDGEDGYKTKKSPITTAERLAGAIHDFVKASSRVIDSLAESGERGVSTPGASGCSTDTQSQEQRADQPIITNNEDVQLLRMRTKKQEIIIFPDPNYLCCVVQNISQITDRSYAT